MFRKVPKKNGYPDVPTNPVGIAIHNLLGTGEFDITISKPGYLTRTLLNERVKLGHTLDINTQLPKIVVLTGKLNPGKFGAVPNLPVGVNPTENTIIVATTDNPLATIEIWLTNELDISGDPTGHTTGTITFAQPYNSILENLDYSSITPKLMVQNTGTAKGTYTITLTFV